MGKRVKRFILFFSIFIFLIIGMWIVSAVNNDITYEQKVSINYGSKWMAVNYAGGGSSAKWMGANFNKASVADGDEELFYLQGQGRGSGAVKSGDEIKFKSARTGYILQYKKLGVFGKDLIFGSEKCDCLVGGKEVTMTIYKESGSDGNTIRCGDFVYFQSGKYYLGVDNGKDYNPAYSDATTKFVFKIYNADGACVAEGTPTTPDTSTIPDTPTPITPDILPSEGEIISCLDLNEIDCANFLKWNYDVLESIESGYPDTSIPAGFCTDEPYSEDIHGYPNCKQTLKCGCEWDDERGECVGSVWAVYTSLTSGGCGDLTLQDSSTSCTIDDDCADNQFCGIHSQVCINKMYFCNAGQKQGDANADGVIDNRDLDIMNRIVLYKDILAGSSSTCCVDINEDNEIDSDDTSMVRSRVDDPTLDLGICPDECIPKNCLGLGKECGSWNNGCGTGANIDCGTSCRPGEYCDRINGICTATPPYCTKKLLGESCDDSNECCSNLCAYSPPYKDNVCLNYIPTDTCKGFGEECDGGTDCCSESCMLSQSTGVSTCSAPDITVTPICKSLGQGCNTPGECCSDVCISNAQKAQPPAEKEQPLLEGSCAMEGQLCGGYTEMPCCEGSDGSKLSCAVTGLGDVGYCKKILEEASKSGVCLQIGQKCYDPLTGNDLLGDCCAAYECDLVSATCIKTDAEEGESCNALNRFCNERKSLICIQETCQYVPKYCAECIYGGGACSINDNKCCSNLGLLCISGECRQPTKRTDRYFTVEATYNYNWETDAESVSCGNPDLTIINPDITEIIDDEFQDNYDVNDFYAVLITNQITQYQFKFNFPIFEYFDIEDNTETLGFPCYDGIGSAQIVISRGTDIFCTRDIDMASVCQLQPPAKSADAVEKGKGGGGIIGGIIGGVVNFFQNLFGLSG